MTDDSVDARRGYELYFYDIGGVDLDAGFARRATEVTMGFGDEAKIHVDSFAPGYNHLAVTCDGDASILAMYLNAVIIRPRAGDDSSVVNPSAAPGILGDDPTARLVIGRGFAGRIDELAIYDHALSAARVAQHYRVGAGAR